MTDQQKSESESRKEFEAWISAPPIERGVGRFPNNGAWPEQYAQYEVQLAWEAWKEAMNLKWSSELPKVAGWYWVKTPVGINCGALPINEGRGIGLKFDFAFQVYEIRHLANRGWQFAGPIPEPQEISVNQQNKP